MNVPGENGDPVAEKESVWLGMKGRYQWERNFNVVYGSAWKAT